MARPLFWLALATWRLGHCAELSMARVQKSSRGCKDDRKDCASLGALLWAPEGHCRYPTAEMCLKTCGLCWKVKAATNCRNPVHTCKPFCSKKIDFNEFLERALERHELAGVPGPKGRVVSRQPALIEVPGFMTEAEADELVRISRKFGYLPEEALPKSVRHVNKSQCEVPECLMNSFVGEIYRRTGNFLGIPPENFESMEFLDYGPGGHYSPHPDTSIEDLLEPNIVGAGMRILTVFFYLTDVAEGGATMFPKAMLKVPPKKGKMVVWANVRDSIWKEDPYAVHGAQPVKRGRKVASNFWVHALDIRTSEKFSEC